MTAHLGASDVIISKVNIVKIRIIVGDVLLAAQSHQAFISYTK
jgi:hypothetical protein